MAINSKSIIGRAIPALAVIAIIGVAGLFGGCVINTGDFTTTEHRQDKTLHEAAASIILDASTVNGDVTIQEADVDDVEVTYNVFASEGHLQDIQTGTNGTRIDNNTMKIEAVAKINNPNDGFIGSRGADIIVKVPRGSHYGLSLTTVNGNIIVPALKGTSVRASTVNGNVGVNGSAFEEIEAGTTNGDINVRLNESTQFFVDASTVNGHVRHGLIHMAPQKETGRELVGCTEAGNGSLRMKLHAVNGNIEISY